MNWNDFLSDIEEVEAPIVQPDYEASVIEKLRNGSAIWVELNGDLVVIDETYNELDHLDCFRTDGHIFCYEISQVWDHILPEVRQWEVQRGH